MTAERGANRFSAPWSRYLVVLSGLFVLTVGVPAIVQLINGRLLIGGILLAVLMVPMALTVRGYEVVDHELRIRRLFWDTRWSLDGLTAATVVPNAMNASLRTWAIGGLFSFSGHFVNALGRYRAFVTDPERTVVLRLSRGILVVSPDRPEDFVNAVRAEAAARLGGS